MFCGGIFLKIEDCEGEHLIFREKTPPPPQSQLPYIISGHKNKSC